MIWMRRLISKAHGLLCFVEQLANKDDMAAAVGKEGVWADSQD